MHFKTLQWQPTPPSFWTAPSCHPIYSMKRFAINCEVRCVICWLFFASWIGSDDLIDNDGLLTYVTEELKNIVDKYARMLGNLCQIDAIANVSVTTTYNTGHFEWLISVHRLMATLAWLGEPVPVWWEQAEINFEPCRERRRVDRFKLPIDWHGLWFVARVECCSKNRINLFIF